MSSRSRTVTRRVVAAGATLLAGATTALVLAVGSAGAAPAAAPVIPLPAPVPSLVTTLGGVLSSAVPGLGDLGTLGTSGTNPLGYAITSPATGTVVTTDTPPVAVAVSCPLGLCVAGRVRLTAVDPAGSTGCDAVAVPLTVDGSSLTGTFDPSDPYPTGCGALAGLPAYDGTWTLTLSGDSSASQPLVLRIPPAAPVAPTLTAAPDGLAVRWTGGREPDAVAGLVTLDPGTSGSRQVQSPCAAGATCTLDVPAGDGAHTVTVATVRTVGPGGAALVGPPSPASALTLGAGRATASAAPLAGVTGTLPTASAGSFASALAHPAPAARSDIPTLPAGPAAASLLPAAPAAPAEGSDGPYDSALAYGLPAPETVGHTTALPGTDPGGSRAVWLGIAGALVLLLAAAHLRVWTRILHG